MPRLGRSRPKLSRRCERDSVHAASVQVFVMTQNWGDSYFHFMCESLPRIMLMLDVLRDHPGITVSSRRPWSTRGRGPCLPGTWAALPSRFPLVCSSLVL